MEVTLLDFCLINLISYIAGLGTGLMICCKNKDKFFVKSRSNDNLSNLQGQVSSSVYSTPPVIASAPQVDKTPVKITLE
tara:strand:- start:1675 stop:1911 length:237 start_codon:yes stop_codon:yes gene_type:complete